MPSRPPAPETPARPTRDHVRLELGRRAAKASLYLEGRPIFTVRVESRVGDWSSITAAVCALQDLERQLREHFTHHSHSEYGHIGEAPR